MTDYKHYHHWQRREKLSRITETVTVLMIGAILGMVILSLAKRADGQQVVLKDCTTCHSKIQEFAEYFRRHGSKQPHRMAEAVIATRNPRLMAAIAKIESRGNPDIRKTGYRNRHDGAFQVNRRYWGKVSHDPVEQALQADSILAELTQTMPLDKALATYGGCSTSQYSKRVLAELVAVP